MFTAMAVHEESSVGYKQCSICKETKSIKDFTGKTRYKTKDGTEKCTITPYCKVCLRGIRAKWVEQNPFYWIAKRHKISMEEANYWYLKSMESCEICGHRWLEGDDKLCIDHDHTTGKVRGILCKHCNYVLGHSYEKKEILAKTMAYIDKHKES
jgi:hypothetical protein